MAKFDGREISRDNIALSQGTPRLPNTQIKLGSSINVLIENECLQPFQNIPSFTSRDSIQ